jgi:hypothetical protein
MNKLEEQLEALLMAFGQGDAAQAMKIVKRLEFLLEDGEDLPFVDQNPGGWTIGKHQ